MPAARGRRSRPDRARLGGSIRNVVLILFLLQVCALFPGTPSARCRYFLVSRDALVLVALALEAPPPAPRVLTTARTLAPHSWGSRFGS